MKQVILLLVLIGCAKSPSTLRDAPVFLVAGQSNATSHNLLHPLHYSSTGKVTIEDQTHTRQVPAAASPFDTSVSWIYLGDMMDRDVTFINVAVDGTNTDWWRSHAYTRILDQLRIQKIDAVLWVQGEHDLLEGFSENQTYDNLLWLIQITREVQPNLKWIIAINSFKTTPQDNPTRRAEQRIIDDGFALQGPDTDVIRQNPEWTDGPDGTHFAGPGIGVHAKLWFDVLSKQLE